MYSFESNVNVINSEKSAVIRDDMFKIGFKSGLYRSATQFQSIRYQSQAVKLSYDLLNAPKKDADSNPIVIMHGLMGNKMNNRTLARLLRDKLNKDVYLLDMRNHGTSPHVKPHDYSSMSQDIVQFINDKQLHEPVLIGHSMGAKAGMECVLKNKDIASMLVCLDNAPICSVPNGKYTQYISKLQEICGNDTVQTLKEADQIMATVESDKFIRGFLLTCLKRVQETDGKWQFQSKMPLDIMKDAIIKGNISGWDLDSRTYRWCKPTLFIRGTDSAHIADEYIPTLGLFFPCFEIRDVKAGHYLNVTNAEECSDLITEFVNRHSE